MRLNPFSAFGRKRVGESEDDDRAGSSNRPASGGAQPEPTDDPMAALRDIKRFGFAKRPDGTVIMRSDLHEMAPGLASGLASDDDQPLDDPTQPKSERHVEYGRNSDLAGVAHASQCPESSALDGAGTTSRAWSPEPQPEPQAELPTEPDRTSKSQEETPAAMSAQIEHGAADASTDQAGPLKRTAHTERLRAMLGDVPAPVPVADEASQLADSDGSWRARPKRLAPCLDGSPDGSRPGSLMPSAGPQTTSLTHDSGADGEIGTVEGMDQLAIGDDDDADDLDDVAVTIGRVVSTRGFVVQGALFDDVGGQASKAARMGTLVSMNGVDSRVFGIVNGLEREQKAGAAQAERTVFEIQILGEIADDHSGFQRGVTSFPPLDAPITTVTRRDIGAIYARPTVSNVHIGQLRHNPKIPAFVMTDNLLGKHFAVLGTTGSGKSCAVTVILQSILTEHPRGHIVLLDPHNEYSHAFGEHAELLNPSNLQLPYWLLNVEEIEHILLGGGSQDHRDAQSNLLKDAIVHAKRAFAGDVDGNSQITVDTPVPYRLSDLVATLKEGMGMLNKAEGAARYLKLINRIESLRADRRYGFMFSSLAVKDNMEQILAQLLRLPTNDNPHHRSPTVQPRC